MSDTSLALLGELSSAAASSNLIPVSKVAPADNKQLITSQSSDVKKVEDISTPITAGESVDSFFVCHHSWTDGRAVRQACF